MEKTGREAHNAAGDDESAAVMKEAQEKCHSILQTVTDDEEEDDLDLLG